MTITTSCPELDLAYRPMFAVTGTLEITQSVSLRGLAIECLKLADHRSERGGAF